MSRYSNQLVAPSQIRVTFGALARPASALRYVPIAQFERMFLCQINSLPQNVCLLGWLKRERCWYCAPTPFCVQRTTHASNVLNDHIAQLLTFWSKHLVESLSVSTLWFAFCFYDGWRERNLFSAAYRWVTPPDLSSHVEWRGEPGEIPRLSPTRHWIACLGAHRGDPSALLQPDPRYLKDAYQTLFAEVGSFKTPWLTRKSHAVLAASDHGESSNLFAPSTDPSMHPRRVFRAMVATQALNVDVFLGQPFSMREQMKYRYIVDIDGFVRTWDAWAWKMMSGSTVLSVESPWTSFFSEQFAPWEHYVPVSNDCSDLAEKLEWCRNHGTECAAIAQRAGERASIVYDPTTVAEVLLKSFRQKLAEPLPAEFPAG